MGHINLPPPRRGPSRPWTLLDIAAFFLFALVLLFLLLVLTPLGDPLAAGSSPSRDTIISALDSSASGGSGQVSVDACPIEDVDYMPCEDPKRSSHFSREMNFYRERHCPVPGETPLCLVPPPKGYRIPVPWPDSLHKIWHDNMPYGKIAERKGHQGWMKQEGSYFIFPGGGTMFPDGAEQYIAKLAQYIPIKSGWIRTALDMGCGVASFGGYMLKENIITMSFAPRDSHKSQIQFALERGIPAFVAMLGTRRLPFSAHSFDLVHCSRCLIPFTAYNGTYLIEVNRLLRPGGYLVISGPPVQWAKQEKEWADLQKLAENLCYELITVDGNTAIWKKPREPLCRQFAEYFCPATNYDDSSEAWYYKLKSCVTQGTLTVEISLNNLPNWPQRLSKATTRIPLMQTGANVFEADTKRWVRRVAYYKNSLGVSLGTTHVRNVMDMNAFYGGFAAALINDPVWVMNVIPATKQLTLDVIYDRGLIGVYHDWCEAFSTYPRTYDLLHVSGINSLIRDSTSGNARCHLVDVLVEMDRILRPEGTVIIRDSHDVINKVTGIAHAIRWTSEVYENEPESNNDEKILVAKKTFWKSH
ncbi:S-adenosyl-L-methionine-dependent methyltransferases superfamily protein [Rhynchospora pubera]|uniref:Methyltransferase n=1 Tax=Rhynchospora pubera TaxID=906938 RepID=A0AAV8BWG3_9POAL|nr:S-adenosyl-L-methionine-dependent methyltransferases superfamily protein [Rhynchospora pubera]